jgi:hypothetical protein
MVEPFSGLCGRMRDVPAVRQGPGWSGGSEPRGRKRGAISAPPPGLERGDGAERQGVNAGGVNSNSTCGFARSCSRATVASTTGVTSTTVASRLSTAVTTLATANTSAISRTGRPRELTAIRRPAASNPNPPSTTPSTNSP